MSGDRRVAESVKPPSVDVRSADADRDGDEATRDTDLTSHASVAPSDAMRSKMQELDASVPPTDGEPAAPPSHDLAAGPEMQARLDLLSAPEKSGDPDLSNFGEAATRDLHFESVAGQRVVPEKPTLSSAEQNDIQDCHLIAAMDAVSYAEPERWSEIVHDQGDTVTVDLNRDGRVTPVTVDKTVLVDDFGDPVGASSDDHTTMAPLVEKAYATEFADNSYAELDKGGLPHEALESLTGRPGHWSSPSELGRENVRALVDDGHPVCAGSRPSSELSESDRRYRKDDPNMKLPEGAHAYVVTGVDDSGQVQLHNPWGMRHASMSWDKFERQFDYVGWT